MLPFNIRWTTIEGNKILFTGGVPVGAGIQGSIWGPSQLILRSTIFAQNELVEDDVTRVENIRLGPGFLITSEGYNLFDDDPDQGENDELPGGTDKTMKRQWFYDLGDYGGLTETKPPKPPFAGGTTWAFNMGGPVDEPLDQRKETRPKHGAPDVGAYECNSQECVTETPPPPISSPPKGSGSDSPVGTNEPAGPRDDDARANMSPDGVATPESATAGFGDGAWSHTLPIMTAPVLPWDDPLLAAELSLAWAR
jgi:hypothetical protein